MGAVDARGGGGEDGHNHGDGVAGGDEQGVGLVEDADLEGEVVVGAEEGQTLAEEADENDGEVAVLEEAVVEHAVLLEEGLVDGEGNDESHADAEGGGDVGIGPRIRVLGPGEADAEEDDS